MTRAAKPILDREVEALIEQATKPAERDNYIRSETIPGRGVVKLTTVIDGKDLAWIEFGKGEQLDGLIATLEARRAELG